MHAVEDNRAVERLEHLPGTDVDRLRRAHLPMSATRSTSVFVPVRRPTNATVPPSRTAATASLRAIGQIRPVPSPCSRLSDVLLTPAAAGEAPVGLASTGDPAFSRIWTLLGVPCLSLPVLRGPAGLPLGLQLIGARGRDEDLLAAASWIENRLR
jgi:hypothetical protein